SVMEIYRACCTAAGKPDVEPRILNEAVGEIRDQYLDASRARDILGWQASVDLVSGLDRTYCWYGDALAGNTASQ
ncbi:MAG: hypothetical protein QF419_07530, partial [Acidimicrobiales bacterium]|nr:hypothetical protein [Acidimicrobiales bacterium]